jgi:hypothetical protein
MPGGLLLRLETLMGPNMGYGNCPRYLLRLILMRNPLVILGSWISVLLVFVSGVH